MTSNQHLDEHIKAICPEPISLPAIMSADYQVCTFRFAGSDQDGDLDPQEAINRALEENPRNASISPPVKNDAEGLNQGPAQLAIWTSKLWAAGRTLNVGFLGGSQWQQDQIKYFAPEWCQYANINLAFPAGGPYDILISFDSTGGSWSYHGTDSSHYSSTNQASMNYGWIDQNRPVDQLRQVVLHEFGHALGAVHEHQSPLETIQWNKEEVYRSLGGPPNNWSRAKVDSNMFVKYGKLVTLHLTMRFSRLREHQCRLAPRLRHSATKGVRSLFNHAVLM